MTVSIVALDYTPAIEQGGGIGRYVRELVSALAHVDHSTDYRLFASGVNNSTSLIHLGDNFTWKPTRLSPAWLARIWHRARLPFPVECFTGDVDLFHATDFVLPPVKRPTKTLLTVHDLSFLRVPEAASPNLRRYLNVVVPRSTTRATHILADSQATKADLIEFYNLPPDKISVLYSGVDSQFRPVVDNTASTQVRSKYKLGPRPYIFSIGTVQPRKNYGRLIEALADLRSQHYDIDLVIAGGRGWLEDPIYDTLNRLNMQDHVHFTGFVDDSDLPALYSEATCVAFPSLYEGFGFPVLEAMACGTPVVTSNVSSLPEVAGDAALMVDAYDTEALTAALQQLMNDTELRRELTAKGFIQAKRFSWLDSARHLKEIYDALLA